MGRADQDTDGKPPSVSGLEQGLHYARMMGTAHNSARPGRLGGQGFSETSGGREATFPKRKAEGLGAPAVTCPHSLATRFGALAGGKTSPPSTAPGHLFVFENARARSARKFLIYNSKATQNRGTVT